MRIWSNIKQVLDDLIMKPRRLDRELAQATAVAGTNLLLILREHASGRPGPEVETGAFRDAMQVEMQLRNPYTVMGFNNSPQANRLELGFVGRDSRGRLYHQPPYPWLAPSMEEFAPIWQKLMADAVKRAMS